MAFVPYEDPRSLRGEGNPTSSSYPSYRQAVEHLEAEIEDEDDGFVCMILPPLAAGHVICFLLAAEGYYTLSLLDRPDQGSYILAEGEDKLGVRRVQLVFLSILGFGDLITALSGLLGIWISRNELPTFIRKYFSIAQGTTSNVLVGLLVAWRGLVLFSVIPWFGVLLAADPKEDLRSLRLITGILYLLLCAYILFVLTVVVAKSVQEGRALQQRLMWKDAEKRYEVLERAYLAGYPDPAEQLPGFSDRTPVLFGCVPLDYAVAAYVLSMFIACIVWFIRLIDSGRSSAGWAFLVHNPKADTTFALEVLIYVLTFISSTLALAVFAHRYGGRDEAPDSARTQKRCSLAMLLYFVVSTMRFAFFVPITGMAMADRDICGLYVRGLDEMSTAALWSNPGAGMHCSGEDVSVIVTSLVALLLDAYLLTGVLQLWQDFRAEYLVEEVDMKAGATMGATFPGARQFYGTATPQACPEGRY